MMCSNQNVAVVKKRKQSHTVLWPFTTMKPSLMLGTSTGQDLLFERIMSKSQTSACKITHRFTSTSAALTLSTISYIFTQHISPMELRDTTLPLSTLATRCFPGTAHSSYSCCLPTLPCLLAKPEQGNDAPDPPHCF